MVLNPLRGQNTNNYRWFPFKPISMKNLLLCLFGLFFLLNILSAQQPPFTKASERMHSSKERSLLAENSPINAIDFHSIGPTVFSGRITDIAVDEKDPSHFFAAYASGGLWWTENNGTSFTPLFENETVMTIGDIAVNWQDSIIWIGTGEVNSSRSSYAGVGVYKSTDWGKSWSYQGLPESHHTARLVLHPTDKNTVWVAMLGHLYSPNKERGIFKTTDGGKTWNQTLFVDENSGAIDLLLDPTNPEVLYAATWHRERRAWNFVESGLGSGIYKSIDGGQNWNKLNIDGAGFPNGEGVGRIGLCLYKKDNQTVLYAILDNYDRRPAKKKKKKDDLTKDALRQMSKNEFINLPKGKVESYLNDNNFPEKYDYANIIKMMKSDVIKPSALVEYIEDANQLLFDTPVIGAEIYRSNDEGKTWFKTHEDYLDQVYNSYGYYFGQIRVSPHNPDKIYFAGVPVVRSDDGGKTFNNINGANVHVDHHALWCNPERDKHLILGNDGGINISYDDGENWIKCNYPPVGQFYAIAYDMAKPYNIYGGLQDNGVWVGSSKYKQSTRWHNTGHYQYKELLGGDGMQIQIDNRDNNTVYTGFQFGWYFRVNKNTSEQTLIKPKHDLGERPLRFNWQTPIHLSVHNQDILYLGANKLYRSMNQGNDWEAISEDLTKGGKKGDVAYGTITCLDESAEQFGKIIVGTDDGNVQLTTNGGKDWVQINKGLPKDMWVTTVYLSRQEDQTIYASLNGYRWDDFNPYLFKSTNDGKDWQKIGTDLPMEPINVVHEDPKNKNLIYVGTDNGLYISMDAGNSFQLMNNGLPAVSVHDVAVHPRENDLIVGTHGRSIYIADVSYLQKIAGDGQYEPLVVYEIGTIKKPRGLGSKWNIWTRDQDKTMNIPFYSNKAGQTTIEILTENGLSVHQESIEADKGLNFIPYDFSIKNKSNAKKLKDAEGNPLDKSPDGVFYLPLGAYTIKIKKENVVKETKFVFE